MWMFVTARENIYHAYKLLTIVCFEKCCNNVLEMWPQWSAVVSGGQYYINHHSDKIAITINLLTSTKVSTWMKMLILNCQLLYTTLHMYIHSVYKESSRHCLSIEKITCFGDLKPLYITTTLPNLGTYLIYVSPCAKLEFQINHINLNKWHMWAYNKL